MRRDLRAGLVAQFRRVVEWVLRATLKWLWVIDSPCPGKEETAFSRDKSATFARALAVKASADEEHEDVVAALAVKAVRTTNPLLLDYINILRELGIAYQPKIGRRPARRFVSLWPHLCRGQQGRRHVCT